jgi:hypothetical protein
MAAKTEKTTAAGTANLFVLMEGSLDVQAAGAEKTYTTKLDCFVALSFLRIVFDSQEPDSNAPGSRANRGVSLLAGPRDTQEAHALAG